MLGNKVAITVLLCLCILKHSNVTSMFANLMRVLFPPHKNTIVYSAISNAGLSPTLNTLKNLYFHD